MPTANKPESDTKSDTVKLIIRQMNGIMRGEMTLNGHTSELYKKSSDLDKSIILKNMRDVASSHYKTECYLSEVL